MKILVTYAQPAWIMSVLDSIKPRLPEGIEVVSTTSSIHALDIIKQSPEEIALLITGVRFYSDSKSHQLDSEQMIRIVRKELKLLTPIIVFMTILPYDWPSLYCGERILCYYGMIHSQYEVAGNWLFKLFHSSEEPFDRNQFALTVIKALEI